MSRSLISNVLFRLLLCQLSLCYYSDYASLYILPVSLCLNNLLCWTGYCSSNIYFYILHFTATVKSMNELFFIQNAFFSLSILFSIISHNLSQLLQIDLIITVARHAASWCKLQPVNVMSLPLVYDLLDKESSGSWCVWRAAVRAAPTAQTRAALPVNSRVCRWSAFLLRRPSSNLFSVSRFL